jgi:hypothetical protein
LVTDLKDVNLKRWDGKDYNAYCIGFFPPTDAHFLAKYFNPIDENKSNDWTKLWQRVIAENTLIRTLNNDSIESVEIDYFDQWLLSLCKDEFQFAAQILGGCLVELNFNVGDYTLNWRLITLASTVLEFRGTLSNIRDYEVQLTNNK